MKKQLILLSLVFLMPVASLAERPNVLFIAVDDLNDWVGCLGGNPQAITPNFDRYVKDHAMVMNKAYCPSTVCGPDALRVADRKTRDVHGGIREWAKPETRAESEGS